MCVTCHSDQFELIRPTSASKLPGESGQGVNYSVMLDKLSHSKNSNQPHTHTLRHTYKILSKKLASCFVLTVVSTVVVVYNAATEMNLF